MEEIKEVSLPEMLDARERRVWKQQALLDKFKTPLVCFTMNIAGPIKNNTLILRGFEAGCQALEMSFRREKMNVLHKEIISAKTGNEAFYVVDAKAIKIKAVTSEIEDSSPMALVA